MSKETRRTSLRWIPIAAVAFLAGIALRGYPPEAHAQAVPRGQSMFPVTAPGRGVGHNVLFVVDGETRRLLVFEHIAGGKLELVQARDIQWDLRLEDFPSQKDKKNQRRQKPSVENVKKVVKD